MKKYQYARVVRWVASCRYVKTLRQGVHYGDEQTLRKMLQVHADRTCRRLFFERVPEHKRVRVRIY